MAHTRLSSRSRKASLLRLLATLGCAWGLAPWSAGAEVATADEYLEFIRRQAAALHAGDAPPQTLEAWIRQREATRARLAEAFGGFPVERCPLAPRLLGTLVRDGYRVEKVVFQTFPNVWMTANAYVPDTPGKHPAILSVHGHWRGAKQDPVVQARAIGAAKLGFFVLSVDAFGAGERGVGKALGEYHGALTGATLLPVGLPLSGLQVYENARAVDYLQSRGEVDAERIGVTGASGGGNQTMYAGALDQRLKAVVPVCSVGNYQAYLGAGCCLCELVPGALRFTEEGSVLGMVAPRGLLVINATRDAPQFSVGEAQKSIALAAPVFQLYGRADHVRHGVFESHHDYNQAMRAAMYGWMARALKDEGDGTPIAEPAFQTEHPETLRCYPGESRPDDWVTIPRFAAEAGRKLLSGRPALSDAHALEQTRARLRRALVETVFGGFPDVPPVEPKLGPAPEGHAQLLKFQPEPGLNLEARVEAGSAPGAQLVILIDLEGGEHAAAGALAREVRQAGLGLVTLDLRATGRRGSPRHTTAQVPDHNSAEWGVWLGRPLLGQWAFDVQRLLDALERTREGGLPPQVILLGDGPGGFVSLAAGAIDRRVTTVATVGTLASFLTDVPYVGQPLGIMAPGIVRHVGDVADLAALVAPRRVLLAGGVAGSGEPLDAGQLSAAFERAASVFEVLSARGELTLLPTTSPADVVRALR
jgi:cephalosporin-C deacetylase-like acetyl esterase